MSKFVADSWDEDDSEQKSNQAAAVRNKPIAAYSGFIPSNPYSNVDWTATSSGWPDEQRLPSSSANSALGQGDQPDTRPTILQRAPDEDQATGDFLPDGTTIHDHLAQQSMEKEAEYAAVRAAIFNGNAELSADSPQPKQQAGRRKLYNPNTNSTEPWNKRGNRGNRRGRGRNQRGGNRGRQAPTKRDGPDAVPPANAEPATAVPPVLQNLGSQAGSHVRGSRRGQQQTAAILEHMTSGQASNKSRGGRGRGRGRRKAGRGRSRGRGGSQRGANYPAYDPDFDRSLDRYTKRFDPGFGDKTPTNEVRPEKTYETEFPSLR